jgi:hypothetical protein
MNWSIRLYTMNRDMSFIPSRYSLMRTSLNRLWHVYTGRASRIQMTPGSLSRPYTKTFQNLSPATWSATLTPQWHLKPFFARIARSKEGTVVPLPQHCRHPFDHWKATDALSYPHDTSEVIMTSITAPRRGFIFPICDLLKQ